MHATNKMTYQEIIDKLKVLIQKLKNLLAIQAIKQIPSPNFTIGRNGQKPIAVVLHIMGGSIGSCDNWFSQSISHVSAHYGIGQNGEIHQYVKEENQAWANGGRNKPTWQLIKPEDPNQYTIAIEHEGNEYSVWSDAMKDASSNLIQQICARYNIPIDRSHIIGHYEINSVTRPNCPAVNKAIIDEIISKVVLLSQK